MADHAADAAGRETALSRGWAARVETDRRNLAREGAARRLRRHDAQAVVALVQRTFKSFQHGISQRKAQHFMARFPFGRAMQRPPSPRQISCHPAHALAAAMPNDPALLCVRICESLQCDRPNGPDQPTVRAPPHIELSVVRRILVVPTPPSAAAESREAAHAPPPPRDPCSTERVARLIRSTSLTSEQVRRACRFPRPEADLFRPHHRRIVRARAFGPVVRPPARTGDQRAVPSHRPMGGP
jgi:hypothetical protein